MNNNDKGIGCVNFTILFLVILFLSVLLMSIGPTGIAIGCFSIGAVLIIIYVVFEKSDY